MSLLLRTGALDPDTGRFVRSDGVESTLTSREVALLVRLAAESGRDVPREILERDVLSLAATTASRALDAAVARLRRKIEPDAAHPATLLTGHGCGYRLLLATIGTEERRAPPSPRLLLGDRWVNLDSGCLDDGTRLTPIELRILDALASGHRFDTHALARSLGVRADRAAVVRSVYRLRLKLEAEPHAPRILVGGRDGYRLEVQRSLDLVHLEATLWSLAEHASRVLGFGDFVIYARRGEALVQVAAAGPKAPAPRQLHSPLTLALERGLVGAAARSAQPVCVDDVRDDPRYVVDGHPGRSELAVPVRWNGHVVGALDSESARPRAYGERERVAMASLADVAAACLSDLARVNG